MGREAAAGEGEAKDSTGPEEEGGAAVLTESIQVDSSDIFFCLGSSVCCLLRVAQPQRPSLPEASWLM